MDQDDSMLSTPSSAQDDFYDDSLYPESNNTTTHPPITTNLTSYVAAQTPQNDHLNAAAPGELSPPRSQSISHTGATNGFSSGGGLTKGGGAVEDDEAYLSDDDEAVDVKGPAVKEDKEKPGAGWKNKKVQEEMARAWENVVDRDFDVKAFGDPLAHKVGK